MNIPFVDLSRQYQQLKLELDSAIAEVLSQSSFVGGPLVARFEEAFSNLFEGECISCANGTDAIEIALQALGVGQGDEVIVPSMTWIATAGAVVNVGATPVFVEVDAHYTMDVTDVASKITPKTKVIIPVHLFGCPADMKTLNVLAEKHNLFLIEDCAQAHRAEIDSKQIGQWSDIATFSFYPSKNIGAYGDAGCVLTRNSELAAKAKMIAQQGQQGKNNHIMVGRNSRMDAIQAAILNVKLPYLDEWTSKRRKVAQWYDQYLDGLDLKLPSSPAGMKHVYHLYVIETDRRDELKAYLMENGIQTAIHYPTPLPLLEVFDQYTSIKKEDFTRSSQICERILSLPMFPELEEKEIAYISGKIKNFFELND